MTNPFFFKAELNRKTLLYNVTTDLDKLYPNASVVIANCINSKERSHHRNDDLQELTEITCAIDDGLWELYLTGIFHQSEVCFGVNCITLLKGGLSI